MAPQPFRTTTAATAAAATTAAALLSLLTNVVTLCWQWSEGVRKERREGVRK